jgi:hypothetical protein
MEDSMYRVRTGLLRLAASAAVALIAYALCAAPALAGGGDDLTLSHAVASGVSMFGAFGPVGTGCDASTAGSNCTFFTTTFTTKGKAEPGGPFTQTGTSTVYFGLNGSALTFAASLTLLGAPVGFCAPTFVTAHTVFANGTNDVNASGTICCTASPPTSPSAVCGALPIGPPSTTQTSGTCIGGTGKYAGTQCSSQATSSSSDGVHFIVRGETVYTKK